MKLNDTIAHLENSICGVGNVPVLVKDKDGNVTNIIGLRPTDDAIVITTDKGKSENIGSLIDSIWKCSQKEDIEILLEGNEDFIFYTGFHGKERCLYISKS